MIDHGVIISYGSQQPFKIAFGDIRKCPWFDIIAKGELQSNSSITNQTWLQEAHTLNIFQILTRHKSTLGSCRVHLGETNTSQPFGTQQKDGREGFVYIMTVSLAMV